MNISKFKKQTYTTGKTPIEKMERLSKELNGPELFIKRDDLLGLTLGGNKTRKLEYLVADALEQGADTLITCGAIQSNHCRLTLSAAIKEGLKCQFVLEERVPGTYKKAASGNNLLFTILGAEKQVVVPGGSNMLEAMEALAADLVKQGRKPYIIPGGGSNAIGATGYVSCALEILEQMKAENLEFDYIVCGSGSTGTHAGILTGIAGSGSKIPVVGISVSRQTKQQQEMVYKLVQTTSERVGVDESIAIEQVVVQDQFVGEGYSIPTDSMIEAVKMFGSLEGLILDPVYTGKIGAGLIGLVRNGYFKKTDKILFLHTGGSPALYAYANLFFEEEACI